jgi:hypothetical protein
MNYQMNSLDKTLVELHGMLKIAKESIENNPAHVMMVQKESKERKRWTPPKGNVKGMDAPKDPSRSNPKPKGKSGPSSNDECFHCHDKGHWSINYKNCLEDLNKKKGSETSASGLL